MPARRGEPQQLEKLMRDPSRHAGKEEKAEWRSSLSRNTSRKYKMVNARVSQILVFQTVLTF
jgi:hypothetical protein